MSTKIKCIFFSEFHPTTGPRILCQVPDDYISKEYFDAVHSYIITKQELQSRLITVNALGHKILGIQVCIEDKKYDRNALRFNCCFMFDSETRTARYEPVVRKLASYFTQLELENSFLSDEEKKGDIARYLQEIRTKLNQSGSCRLRMNETLNTSDEFCTIYLKLSPTIEDPKPVQDHDVPVFVQVKPKVINNQWDLTTQQICPENTNFVHPFYSGIHGYNFQGMHGYKEYIGLLRDTGVFQWKSLLTIWKDKVLQYIDGYNHVAKIAAEADIEINLVKACLQNLLHIDVITIVSIFQYSNMYTTTSAIKNLADDQQLQEECLKNVAAKARVKPIFRDVFMLYTSLAPGLTVKDLCMRFNPHSLNIDEKKLIQFGLKNKVLRRLQGYPVKLPSDVRSCPKVQALSKWLNGTHGLDEISCKSGMKYKELDEIIENDPSIVMCWK